MTNKQTIPLTNKTMIRQIQIKTIETMRKLYIKNKLNTGKKTLTATKK
jgi:hypothetical protein